ncbi:type II toxin-antitoxin system HicA family toxin [Leuconostoc citreum]|uniref:type II toxin-antitoxin system HicA family toxin n=1 Tax=Leuconostoc citreum TaxID=33964 RepID=UPI003D7FAA1B
MIKKGDVHMPLSVRKMIKLLENNGFVEVSQSGSHKKFVNKKTGKTTTVPYHTGGREIPKGTERNILKQAGLK